MSDNITQFSGAQRWLSNFAESPVEMDGEIYPTVEHAYQASKTFHEVLRAQIRLCKSPAEAKRAGRHVSIRDDWNDSTKKRVMLSLLRKKFSIPEYGQKLLNTGDCKIVEGNTWGDTFWGVCRGVGSNVLGRLIMQVREELSR